MPLVVPPLAAPEVPLEAPELPAVVVEVDDPDADAPVVPEAPAPPLLVLIAPEPWPLAAPWPELP
jgi:hypothetical protein